MILEGSVARSEEEKRAFITKNIYESFEELVQKYDTSIPNPEIFEGVKDPSTNTRVHKEATIDQLRAYHEQLATNYDPDNFREKLIDILDKHKYKIGEENYKQLKEII